MEKITADMIQEREADSLIEALGNCLELNDDFLSRYCGDEFKALISRIPEHDREYVISGLSERHWFNGSPAGNDTQDIWLDVAEIEYQFEGNPEDVFENPDDFTIHGDLAYLYVGYGLSIEYDRDELNQAIADYLKDNE
jgi:hypothetical protein